MSAVELVDVVERLGMGAGVLVLLWWVLNNVVKRLTEHDKQMVEWSAKHDERCTAQHSALLDGVKALTDRPCLHQVRQEGGD